VNGRRTDQEGRKIKPSAFSSRRKQNQIHLMLGRGIQWWMKRGWCWWFSEAVKRKCKHRGSLPQL